MADNGEEDAHNQPLLGDEERGLFEGVTLEDQPPPPPPPSLPPPPPPNYPPPPSYTSAAYGQPQMPPPAYGQPRGYGQHQQQVQQAQGIMHVPDLPDTIEEWKSTMPLLHTWLYVSIATMVTSALMFWPGFLVGLLATIAASMHVCNCCNGGNASLAGPVTTTYILAAVVVGIDALIIFLLGLQMLITMATGCDPVIEGEDGEDGWIEEEAEVEDKHMPKAARCIILLAVLSLTLTWYCVHCAISVRIMRKAKRVRQWLNPITSGVVVL